MIVGINGFKGSGKDTIGAYLVEKYGFERKSFAAKLKESAASLFNIDPNKWEKWKNDPTMRVMLYKANEDEPWEVESDGDPDYYANTISVRQFLQRYGTEAHRDVFGDDFWVYHGLEDVSLRKDYVLTDARFENELEAIKELGGYNIRVIRSGFGDIDTHASEVVPPAHLIDYEIENNGTIENLYERVDEFIEFSKLQATYY